MFKMTKQEDLMKEMGNTYLQESYCGKAKITTMEKVRGSNGSLSEGIKFIVETQSGIANFSIWYQKKDAQENEFGVKQLSAIMTILKLDPSTLKINTVHEGDRFREIIEMKEELEIGLFLGHFVEEYNGKSIIKHELKGCFSANTNKTVAETFNKLDAKMYKKWIEEAKKKNIDSGFTKQAQTQSAPANTDFHDDEFPF